MDSKRYLVILNANAGSSNTPLLEERIRAGLGEDEGASVFVVRCKDPQQARKTASAAARTGRFDALVIAGGDGSHHHLLDAVADTGLPLGVIPLGTANDLAANFDIKGGQVEAACAVIRAGRTVNLDLIQVGKKCFATGGGLGVPARVAMGVHEMRGRSRAFRLLMRLAGHYIYPIVTLFTLLFTRKLHERYEVVTDRGKRCEIDGYAALLMNFRSLGKHFQAAPSAKQSDGLLDVVLVERRGPRGLARLRFMWTVFHISRGTHMGRSDVHHLRARKLTISAPQGASACIADGELMAVANTLSIKVRKQALSLLVPAVHADRVAKTGFAASQSRVA
ncbi:MAG: hypothetical protein JKY65_32670 [Planctomycetes bacterium]|nr:hypothetical protein [Planctomycetota bacterium]